MASPVTRPPAGNHGDEALDILRRLKPILSGLDERQRKQGEDISRIIGQICQLNQQQRKQGEDIAELKGKVSQLPTLWPLATTILAINSGIVAVAALVVARIRFAVGHG
jgi:hypothetical protein